MTSSKTPVILTHLAFMAAILGHVAVAKTLILTFPPPREVRQPFLSFLGSILETQDLSHFSSTGTGENPAKQTASVIKSSRSRIDPVALIDVNKPSFPNDIVADQKIYTKTPFLDKPVPDNDFGREFGIETRLPKIVPLRLYRQ